VQIQDLTETSGSNVRKYFTFYVLILALYKASKPNTPIASSNEQISEVLSLRSVSAVLLQNKHLRYITAQISLYFCQSDFFYDRHPVVFTVSINNQVFRPTSLYKITETF
jgi:hypothetical protein